jgi:hypothetical protein
MTLKVTWFNDSNFDFKAVDYGANSSPNCSYTQMPSPIMMAKLHDSSTMLYECTLQDALEGIDTVVTYATVQPTKAGGYFWFSIRMWASIVGHAGHWPTWSICCGVVRNGDNPSSHVAPFPWVYCGYRDGDPTVYPESNWRLPQPQAQDYWFNSSDDPSFPSSEMTLVCKPISNPMDLTVSITMGKPRTAT